MFIISVFASAVALVIAIHVYMLRKTARDHEMMLGGPGLEDGDS